MTGFQFQAAPDLGTTVRLDEQVYELRETKPHVRKDGAPTRLLVWESTCPGCGSSFVVTTGLSTKSLNRRCGACRKPLKIVKGRRGRRVKIVVQEP
jgi:hypothetical protein